MNTLLIIAGAILFGSCLFVVVAAWLSRHAKPTPTLLCARCGARPARCCQGGRWVCVECAYEEIT